MYKTPIEKSEMANPWPNGITPHYYYTRFIFKMFIGKLSYIKSKPIPFPRSLSSPYGCGAGGRKKLERRAGGSGGAGAGRGVIEC